MEFLIQIEGYVEKPIVLQYEDFKEIPEQIRVEEIVPKFSGIGVRYHDIAVKIGPQPQATHVIFHAVDEFAATIPVEELENALFLYQQNGEPLQKGFPIRLLVPNGSSECLNVKSVVRMEYVHSDEKVPASFGFKNLVEQSELTSQ